MKLRNKKTGKIVDVDFIYPETTEFFYPNFRLVDFNELFEDYEEPKGYYYVTTTGLIKYDDTPFSAIHKDRKQIGNYFETKEEAEKAVEKLKAWKRLKDKGFRFIDHIDRDSGQGMTRYEWDGYVNGEDLDLLFGGGE